MRSDSEPPKMRSLKRRERYDDKNVIAISEKRITYMLTKNKIMQQIMTRVRGLMQSRKMDCLSQRRVIHFTALSLISSGLFLKNPNYISDL